MRTVATVIQLDVTRVWFRAGIILKTTLELLLVALLLLSTISRAESQTTNIQDHTAHIRPLHLFPETEIYHGSVSMVFQEDKSASITLEQILTPEYQKNSLGSTATRHLLVIRILLIGCKSPSRTCPQMKWYGI